MELEKILRVLALQKWMILLLCVVSTAVGTLITYAMPEKYSSTALVLIRPQESIGLTNQNTSSSKEMLSLPTSGSTMQVETPSKTYIEVIKSRTVAERVVRMLHLDQPMTRPTFGYYRELWEHFKEQVHMLIDQGWSILQFGRVLTPDPFERAISTLLDNITLTTIKGTYVFEIAYASRDPQEAAEVANAAANMFVEYSSSANATEAKGNREFISKQRDDAQTKMIDMREELKRFKQESQTVSFKEERTEGVKEIAALQASLDKTEVELAGLMNQFTPTNPKVLKVVGERDRLMGAVTQRKQELALLANQEARFGEIELEIKTLEDTYLLLDKEFEEAKIRESKRINEIRVVSKASAALYPYKPIKIYYAGVSLALALIAGFGWALFTEYMDTKIRTIEDVEQVLGGSVLATIPKA